MEVITVDRVKSSSLYSLAVQVGNTRVDAIVDTAAETTLISDKVFQRLDPKPEILGKLKLLAAGRDMTMQGQKVGPVRLKIGSSIFQQVLNVAPIEDDMLLGFDFLHQCGAQLDMKNNCLTIGNNVIQLQLGDQPTRLKTCKVTVAKRCVVPPNSVARVQCILGEHMPDYYIEGAPKSKCAIPRSLHSGCDKPYVCAVNLTNNFHVMKKGGVIGEAMEADVMVEKEHESCASEGEMETEGGVSNEGETQPEIRCSEPVPEHVQSMLEASRGDLTEDQFEMLTGVICDFQDVFAKSSFDLGSFTGIEHVINTKDAGPIQQKMRRTPLKFAKEEENEIDKMLEAGVIQPSISDWASAPVLIRKRDGSVRYCIDYRQVNDITVKDKYPLPLVEECVDTLAGNEWFSKLDANSAYWQIPVKQEDQKKTAFITKYGLYEFVKMPFGLSNSPATFMRAIHLVPRGLNWQTVLAFLDDILVLGKKFKEHLQNLREALTRFREYGLKLKPKKCIFFQKKVQFLGRMVSNDSLEMSEADIEVVKNWPVPTCSKDVERFLGLANYHRAFLSDFAETACPLYDVTGKKPFVWQELQQKAFDTLKTWLIEPPVLTLPNDWDDFILDTDASDRAVGGELLQMQQGQERVIAYASYALTPEQRRYCTTRKELLAVVRMTRQFRHYLLGRPFMIRTDHHSLIWLMRFKDPQGQLARWIEELGQYNMILKYRKGKLHGNVDPLSRVESPLNHYLHGVALKDLPCKGCKHCARAEQNWGTFIEEVDDAVPLSALQSTDGVPTVSTCWEDQNWRWDPGGEPVTVEICRNLPRISLLTESGQPLVDSAPRARESPSIWGFSGEEIQQEQSKDEDLILILSWLSENIRPSDADLALASPATKFYWINKERLKLREGVLHFLRKKETATDLVIPRGLKETALKLHHDLPSSGHQGIARTKIRIKEKFFWYGMGRDIENYVSTCELCNQNKKTTRKGRCPLTSYHAGAPMERVHIDFLGPLTKTKRGNEHILMIVDQFTKWVEVIPLPSQTAEETARAAVNSFFSRFGVPFQLFSDQGKNFESKLFAALCEVLQIHKARTTSYRPASNGQAERFNRTLMDAVRCFVGKKQDNWDEFLPQLAGALRSTVNRSTGFTPNQLMLGREVNIPANLMFSSSTPVATMEVHHYVSELVQNLQQVHELARTELKQSQKRMKKNYDLRILERSYEVGDRIYLLDCAAVKGKSKKLCPPWKGPGIITKKLTPYLFRIQLRNKVMVVNHDRLKPCRDRQVPAWVANFQLEGSASGLDQGDDGIYCICQKPCGGHFMIQCDYCSEWYHGYCINLSPSEALDLDRYKCARCKGNPQL